ncbi:hypothetical protein EBH_0016350 [Eimeria brunetti]|uniref:Uncharacterized protein n=1 Tax=Eimeria brunetti TaxID=51314 RepID=U6LSK7_9EIME|nr:hypothetical protein EBH_0016350 [Eimeria brunetti]
MQAGEDEGSEDCAEGVSPHSQLQTPFLLNQIRNTIDENRRWISTSLYSLLAVLLVFVKKTIPDYRPFFSARRAREAITLRLDTVDLLVGKSGPERPPDAAAAAAAAAAAVPNKQELPAADKAAAPASEGKDGAPPDCIPALRQMLIGRRVYFVPIEADVGFVRADIKFRSGILLKKDLAAYLVAKGLAETSEDSFSPLRPTAASSFFHQVKVQFNYRRVGRQQCSDSLQLHLGYSL